MCGVAGIYKFAGMSDSGVDRESLIRVRDYMALRGPDDAGVWFSPDNRIGLAHRRLAIIDPGSSGHQPMESPFGDHVISFNGEIYNYRALQKNLIDNGYKLTSNSDTEVLLGLYHLYGESMLDHLRGMYAFALWDNEKQGLFLARDPYGIKPLYYACLRGEIRFASQVKALICGGGISKELNPRAEAGFLLTGSVMEPDTVYRDIEALPAGSALWVDQQGGLRSKLFLDITDLFSRNQTEPIDPEKMREEAREALLDSVKHHLVADVRVGSFLSAGMDSGAITSLAAEVLSDPINSVTLGFDEYRGSDNDETVLAARVAEQLNTNHTTRVVTHTEFEQDFDSLLAAMDQPTIDGINTWFVSKAAAEQGLKVMLSGIGGDELLGGYPSFQDIPAWNRRFGFCRYLPSIGKVSSSMARPLAFLPMSPKAFGLARYGHTAEGAYLLRRGLYMPWELASLMGRDRAESALESLNIPAVFAPGIASDNPFLMVAAMESRFYLRNQLLRDTDWASMAHSLEVRTPLVDTALTTRLMPLVAASPGKGWLGQSLSDPLPEEVTGRPKTGFTTPVGRWLLQSKNLDQWRKFPWLRYRHVHWSRRYACCLHQMVFANT